MLIKWPSLIILVFFIAGFFYLFYPHIENSFIFFPGSSFVLTPNERNLNYKDVYFTSQDGKKLHGWFFPLEKELPVLLFYHGNAGNISHRLENISLLLKNNVPAFIFDYRGYGKSSGNPSEKGLYLDGLAAYDYLIQKEKISPDRIILFGRSLGASIAIDVSLKRKVRSIIIEGAFTSTREMAKTIPLFNLLSPFLPANYNNLEKVAQISVPKLIIHSEDDEIVPFAMGRKLFDTANAPKYFLRLKGGGHNDSYIVGGKDYFQAIRTFARDSRI